MKRPFSAIIEDVIVNPEGLPPILVNFQNGKLNDSEAAQLECGFFHDKKENRKVLAVSNGRVVYKGYKPDPDKQMTQTYIAIHNKNTGKIRMIQTERWNLVPVLDRLVMKEHDETDQAKIVRLNKLFGSKKSIRKTELYERMQINVESMKDQLKQSAENAQINVADLTTNNEDTSNFILPPCDRSANNVEDVYSVYDIVPKDALKTLHEKARMLTQENAVADGNTQFFTNVLSQLRNVRKGYKKIAILMYIEAVATWLSVPMKDAKRKSIDICPISSVINLHIIDAYSVQTANGRQRPTIMRDKAIVHCMILALSILEYQLNLTMFTNLFNFRISIKKLVLLARMLGAVTSKTDKNVVELKLPLPPPISLTKKAAGVKRTKK